MSNRLARTGARIHTLTELRAVTAAMRGIAAARAREAESHLAGVARHAAIVAGAIGDALALAGERSTAPPGSGGRGDPIALLVLSQGGFVGPLNERILAAALAGGEPGMRYLAIGSHGLRAAQDHGLAIAWQRPMAVHAALVPPLAREAAREVLRQLSDAAPRRLMLWHAEVRPGGALGVTARQLLPFDYTRFGVTSSAASRRPRIQIPVGQLLSALTAQFLHGEVQAALLLGLLAENSARLEAVSAMHANLEHKLEDAQAEYRSLRQEEITAEILELSGGRARADARNRQSRPPRTPPAAPGG